MNQTLATLIQQLNAHSVSNPNDYRCLTDQGFLETTDSMTVNLVDAIDAETRSLIGNGDGTINRWALTGLRKAGVNVREAGSPEDPTFVAVVVTCEHGELVIPL